MATANDVVRLVRNILSDDGTRWPDSMLIGFINAGQELIVDIFPAANAVTKTVTPEAGAEQEIPADGMRFLCALQNMGSDGATPGDAILPADEGVLSLFEPGWMSTQATGKIIHYLHDPRTPTKYKLYPPADGNLQIKLQYSARPAACAQRSDPLTLPDQYVQPLVEWCLFRALSSETDAADPAEANGHLQTFFNILGLKEQAIVKYQPKLKDFR